MSNFIEAYNLFKSNLRGVGKILLILFCFSFISGIISGILGPLGIVPAIILVSFNILFQIIMIYRLIINQDNSSTKELFEESISCFKENWKKIICSILLFIAMIIGVMVFFAILYIIVINVNLFMPNPSPIKMLVSLIFCLGIFMVVMVFVAYNSLYRIYYKIAGCVFDVDERNLISTNKKDMRIMAAINTSIYVLLILLTIIITLFFMKELFSTGAMTSAINIEYNLPPLQLIFSAIVAIVCAILNFIFFIKIVLDVSEEAGSTNYTMRNDGIIDVDYFD